MEPIPAKTLAWAIILAIGATKARVVRYDRDTYVTDVAEPEFEFGFKGRKAR